MTIKSNRSWNLEVISKTTKCKHYYFYNEEFVFAYKKIQTCFLIICEYLSKLKACMVIKSYLVR